MAESQTILVVDDQRENVEALSEYLEAQDYQVLRAYDGVEALQCVETHHPDLMLLDVLMPKLNGFQVCRTLKFQEQTRMMPIVIITALNQVEDKIKGIEAGADDFLSKPFNFAEMLARVRSLLRVKALNDQLENAENVIFALARAIEAKDRYTEHHTERVGAYAQAIAKKVGLPVEYQQALLKAGILHDVGKIGIRESILLKPGPLTPEEFNEQKAHPVIGEQICRSLKSIAHLLPIIRHHHERFDGKGYPDGLRGEEIPIEARILAVADAYDAMTTDRPYRARLSEEKAIEILRKGAGEQWDPRMVEVFIGILEHQTPLLPKKCEVRSA